MLRQGLKWASRRGQGPDSLATTDGTAGRGPGSHSCWNVLSASRPANGPGAYHTLRAPAGGPGLKCWSGKPAARGQESTFILPISEQRLNSSAPFTRTHKKVFFLLNNIAKGCKGTYNSHSHVSSTLVKYCDILFDCEYSNYIFFFTFYSREIQFSSNGRRQQCNFNIFQQWTWRILATGNCCKNCFMIVKPGFMMSFMVYGDSNKASPPHGVKRW